MSEIENGGMLVNAANLVKTYHGRTVVNNVSIPYHKPRQIEFARLGIDHTVLSKRYLRALVEEKYVDGWDDPRMPTLCGLRRRGYTPSAIFEFVKRAGISKAYSIVDIGLLEHFLVASEGLGNLVTGGKNGGPVHGAACHGGDHGSVGQPGCLRKGDPDRFHG